MTSAVMSGSMGQRFAERDLRGKLDCVDCHVTQAMCRYGLTLLRLSLGVVFVWFGALKLFPALSPAEALAQRTLHALTLGLVPDGAAITLLALLEVAIGLGLICNLALRATLLLLFFHMLGTATPLLLFPGELFTRFPYAPTMEGQYIIKNIVFVCAGLAVGSTLHRARLRRGSFESPGKAES